MNMSVKGCNLTFNGLLTIVFIMLKLQGSISWPWVWVLCPLWVPIVLGVSVFISFLLISASIAGFSSLSNRRRY